MDGQKKVYKIMNRQISEYMEKGKRLDGRGVFGYRDIIIKADVSKHAEGSVSVKIGKTEVLCGIKMDVGEPYPEHENEGTLITTMELLPLSSPKFEYGPPRIEAIEMARIIDRGVRESGFINFRDLCIKEGEKVWNIFIDIAPINNAGNIIDAGALAAVLALRMAKLPVYDKKTERVQHGEFTKEGLPLTDNMPIATTIYKIKDSLFADPTLQEAESSDGRLTITISHQAKAKEELINALQKGGEAAFTEKEIEKSAEEAGKIFKKLKSIVEEEVKKAESPRNKNTKTCLKN